MDRFRPGATITAREYTEGCYHLGFVNMCRQYYSFTDEELDTEYREWVAYVKEHIPAIYPGIEKIIRRQKQEGGLICVVSQSGSEIIARDYEAHFGFQPDAIYSWDLPKEHRKPSPYALLDIMERYQLTPADLLVVDDMKPACEMAQKAHVKIAFSAWGKLDFPEVSREMKALCDYTFDSTEHLEKFLFE